MFLIFFPVLMIWDSLLLNSSFKQWISHQLVSGIHVAIFLFFVGLGF